MGPGSPTNLTLFHFAMAEGRSDLTKGKKTILLVFGSICQKMGLGLLHIHTKFQPSKSKDKKVYYEPSPFSPFRCVKFLAGRLNMTSRTGKYGFSQTHNMI